MRVCHLVNDFLPFTHAGTEHYLAELVRGLEGFGVSSRILHLAPPAAQVADYAVVPGQYTDVPTFMVGVPPQDRDLLENPTASSAIWDWLVQNRPNVLHIHSLIGFSASLLRALPSDLPVVMTFHDFWFLCANAICIQSDGTPCSGPESEDKCARCVALDSRNRFHQVGGPIEPLEYVRTRNRLHREALSRLNLAISPSHFSRRMYKQYDFSPPDLIRTPLGMVPVRTEAATPPALPGPPLRFVYMGGICWFKGLDLAVQAFAALQPDNARLDIYGVASNPDYLEQVLAMARDIPSIRYHGGYAKEDLPRILSGAHAVILPSRMETYSFVGREALSARVPVIAADCGALPELVRDGRNGLLFRAGDAADLGRALLGMLRDPSLAARLAQGIGPVVSITEDARRLAAHYAKLAGGQP
ncbi:MAG: glycosyltransferase [Desulfovibrio sp.]|uniref:glycosyltransferase n=1 Tax=Desulfovibrio sp. 7SRBS1 TaxID=3378064 RepID=UPI003B3C0C59